MTVNVQDNSNISASAQILMPDWLVEVSEFMIK